MNCNEKVINHIYKLTGQRVNALDISKSLHEIMIYIDKHILHYRYNTISDALNLIPKHSRYLLEFIQLFSVYIDYCKNNDNYKLIKTFMCDNQCNLCKMYHLMTSWGLLMINCLYVKTRTSGRVNQLLHLTMTYNKDVSNFVLYNNETLLDLNSVFNCIQNTKENESMLKESYFLISSGLYLREHFAYFCNKSIDRKHTKFNQTLERIQNHLLQRFESGKILVK